MIHQFTALILSCLMLVVSATSQVGLHFCQCEKTVFMGDCPCDEVPETDEVAPCSCCGSCDDAVPNTPNPCDDCDLTIELEFDDCIPQLGSDFKITSEISDVSSHIYNVSENHRVQTEEVTLLEIRGGPPPNLSNDCPPLFLRHSVFLI